MNCPSCRQALHEDAHFCSNCGLSTNSFNTNTKEVQPETLKYSHSPDPLIGRILDSKYELLERLGEGGMGAVYRARRLHIGDDVAVKVLHADLIVNAKAIERFRREARSAAMISHPNVVSIHDFSDARSSDTPAYIVMELVRGISLRSLLKRAGRLSATRTVALMRDICAGVGIAHRQGVVHRDLKPDNVIVAPASHEGERETAKVVDFGIAKLRDMAAESGLTQTGAVMGTIYYMSPEQCRGEELDARADVYSLGAMIYEMLTGQPPFRANNIAGLISKHVGEAPPAFPADLQVPPALAAACLTALAKNRDSRQADALALGRELQGGLAPIPNSQVSEAQRASARADAPTKSSWVKWAVGGLAVLLLFVVVGGAVAVYLYTTHVSRPPNDSENTPNQSNRRASVAEDSKADGSPPPGSVSAGAIDLDLKGTWTGTYGPLGQPATLIIKHDNGTTFDGTLKQGEVTVYFSGTFDPKSRELLIKESKVLSGDGWSLGEEAGKLSADGTQMSGTGKDAVGGQLGISYQWSFSKQ